MLVEYARVCLTLARVCLTLSRVCLTPSRVCPPPDQDRARIVEEARQLDKQIIVREPHTAHLEQKLQFERVAKISCGESSFTQAELDNG